uniref:Pheromone-binding protein 5 n=1 Tax=Cnaphalocrocis medinalis TaxID=437488 RepID=A0A0U3AN58_CNAME|nr:pheromone-binding protein 5 [Cnaphalocrocis medinalis]
MDGNVKWRLAAILVLILAANVDRVKSSQEVMKKMSTTFFKLLDECKKELSVSDDLIQGLVRFWREDADLGARELGCVIMCIASKQDLVILEDYKMHHENAYNFARDHGADDETAKAIVKIVHDCEKNFDSNPDHCSRVMEVAKCFRDEIHKLKWAPSVEVLIGELMSEA